MTSDHNIDPILMANLRGLGIPHPIPDGDTTWFDDPRVANTASLDADLLEILKVESDMGFEDEVDAWLAVHAWRMLAQRRVVTAIPLLIDLLIHADEDDDWSLEELPEVLASYGPKAANPLIQALRLEPPHAAETWGFVGVVDALKWIALQNAPTKESICEELRSGVLDCCDIFSPTVTAFVIMTFIELKYSPAIPAIELAFRRDLVDQNIVTWKEVVSEFGPMVPEKLTSLNETRSLDSYSGDEWMDRNLMILGSQFRSDTLRFFLLGSILQVKMVSPNEQLKEVMTDFDGEEVAFAAGGQANSFVRNFMGLWNNLASYQDRLFELPSVRDLSEADDDDQEHGRADLAMTKHVFWMCCFVDGLEFEDRSDASALSPEGRVLIDGIFEFLDESRRIPSRGATEQKRNLVTTLREAWARHYLALANSCRQARLMVLAKKKLVAENRHIGRNDPCPCGSGKKFKKCCLM